MMRIGILLVGRASEDLVNQYGTYAEMLVALINSEEKIFEFKTFNILDDEFPEDHLECDGWIITGSPHGVYEELPWMKTISQLINNIYNAGFENISILNIAEQVKSKVTSDIRITESNDPRSYRQNSDKLCKTGFEPRHNVSEAIDEVIAKFRSGELVDSDQNYTVKWMKHLSLNATI